MTSDSNHPFLRPLWRRVLLIAVVLGWAVFEWWHGETFFAVTALAFAAYGIWVFFVKYDPGEASAEDPRDPPARR